MDKEIGKKRMEKEEVVEEETKKSGQVSKRIKVMNGKTEERTKRGRRKEEWEEGNDRGKK